MYYMYCFIAMYCMPCSHLQLEQTSPRPALWSKTGICCKGNSHLLSTVSVVLIHLHDWQQCSVSWISYYPGSTPFVPTVRSHSSRKAMHIPSNKLQRERGTKVSISTQCSSGIRTCTCTCLYICKDLGHLIIANRSKLQCGLFFGTFSHDAFYLYVYVHVYVHLCTVCILHGACEV